MNKVSKVPSRLYIGNIPYKTNALSLKQIFGSVIGVTIPPPDRHTGKPRGFAFVDMPSEKEALDAIQRLNNTDLDGRRITVSFATEKPERPKYPKAKSLGKDICILCLTPHKEVFGFDELIGGICSDCIKTLSFTAYASRLPNLNKFHNEDHPA